MDRRPSRPDGTGSAAGKRAGPAGGGSGAGRRNSLAAEKSRRRIPGKVVNNTDFNYSCCNSFDFEPPTKAQEDRYLLTAKFSFVSAAYSIHVTKYSQNKREGCVVAETDNVATFLLSKLIREFAGEQGFQEIDGTMHDLVIDGVFLELSEVATLGKCLFDDFE